MDAAPDATGRPVRQGIVLFAHGSRDPLWKAPVERVAARISQIDPSALVRCAYLEMQAPDLDHAVQELLDAGARSVRIAPMFFGVGKHLRDDLPGMAARLRQRHPSLDLRIEPPIGEDPVLLDLIARRALERP